jgi:chromate transporter
VWFGIHVIFQEMRPFRGYGLVLSLPVPASIDPWALAIALGAMIAIFGFRVGMIPTLLISSLAGVALHLAFGAG